ncbi:hypothetical protein Patl1_35197 [Pistacia atlantica]|uniref:Uncharacterized protein n=1 Tax=Pistacia atlantica TaxID=434234 RepID=A0ACC0ZWA6_9ROSI|nr:hypothetical protein Patl1_35197 [Pistacia atlantica]
MAVEHLSDLCQSLFDHSLSPLDLLHCLRSDDSVNLGLKSFLAILQHSVRSIGDDSDRLGFSMLGNEQIQFVVSISHLIPFSSRSLCLDMDGVTVLNEVVGKKVRGNNIGLKFDITKAFNIVCWDFVLCVLAACGFDPIFINWVKVLLPAAKLSISVNGSPKEEVLSRVLSKLLEEGQITQFFSWRDYCSVLGVSKNARKSEIKVVIVLQYDFSFLGLWVGDWRKYYGGICFAPVLKEPGAEQKFKEISNAYEVLSDDEYYSLVINFKEAVFGVEKEIEVTRLGSCGTCDGSSAKPGPKPIHKAKKAYP